MNFFSTTQGKGTSTRHSAGFTVVELLVTVTLASILAGLGALSFRDLVSPANLSAKELSGHLRLLRGRAIATTSALLVRIDDENTLSVFASSNCRNAPSSTAWTPLPEASFSLKKNSRIETVTIPGEEPLPSGDLSTFEGFCFDQRGFVSKNIRFSIEETAVKESPSQKWIVELFLGGATEIRG